MNFFLCNYDKTYYKYEVHMPAKQDISRCTRELSIVIKATYISDIVKLETLPL